MSPGVNKIILSDDAPAALSALTERSASGCDEKMPVTVFTLHLRPVEFAGNQS
jgi:hypothetical protein